LVQETESLILEGLQREPDEAWIFRQHRVKETFYALFGPLAVERAFVARNAVDSIPLLEISKAEAGGQDQSGEEK
jgi:hypothetical protein